MALDNPFLQPSAVRKSALQYLFSDEPTTTSNTYQGSSSASVVDTAFGVPQSAQKAEAIALNIANNGGEYNPDDSSDYALEAMQNPGDAWRAFDQYGSKVIGVLGMLGLPFASSIIAATEQNLANKFGEMIGAYVEPLGGELPEGRNPLLAGGLARIGDKFEADNVESLRALRDQFTSDKNVRGYFSAGTDDAIKAVVDSTIKDYNILSPDAYGEKAAEVGTFIENQIAGGLELEGARQAALNFYNPENEYQPPLDPNRGLLTGDPISTGGGDSTPTAPSAGSIWTSADGTPIQSGSGGYVYTGSATAEDRAAGAANPPSAPAPAPEPAPVVTYDPPTPTFDWSSSSDSSSSGGGYSDGYSSSGGGGYSSSADGSYGGYI